MGLGLRVRIHCLYRAEAQGYERIVQRPSFQHNVPHIYFCARGPQGLESVFTTLNPYTIPIKAQHYFV